MKEENIFELLSWYEKGKRDLPWRHTKDPYKIWISEIMLQQTRVEAVKVYYDKFLKKLPTLSDLAEVEEDVLLKLWEGLGYYSRAKNLQKCAQVLINEGQDTLPKKKEELLKLPGIGDYTAGAIASIAYLQPSAAIDGNVMRVLSRVYMDDRDILNPKVRREYSNILEELMIDFPADSFTQSFIELGALVCIPNGMPKCSTCPLQSCCLSYQNKKVLEYPKKKEKKQRKIIKKTVFVFSYQDMYAISKREEKGLLAGMYEFPNIDQQMSLKSLEGYLNSQYYSYDKISFLTEYKHIFSHIEWHMKVYKIELNKPIKEYLMVKKKELEKKYSIPSAFQNIVKKL